MSISWFFFLWYISGSQYKFIPFKIFSCKILIISCEILIITVISNEITNELTIYAKLCQNVTIFYWQEISSLSQMQEKVRACGNSKWSFLSSCSNNCSDNVHLLKYLPIKVPRNGFDSFNCTNQTGMQISKFSFALDK